MTEAMIQLVRERAEEAAARYGRIARMEKTVNDSTILEQYCLSNLLLAELLLAVLDIGRALRQDIAELKADELLHH